METEKFLTQIQKALSCCAGVVGILTILAAFYVEYNNIGLQETINIRILFPFILIFIIIIFLIFGYFLQKKDP